MEGVKTNEKFMSLLLVKRDTYPFKDKRCLPGGFLDIKEDSIYLVKDYSEDYGIVLTDTEPTLPINSVKTKLITRRKNQSSNRIPTTSFTLNKKLFNDIEDYNQIKFILHPRLKDKYRNKLGLISIKLIK